MASVRDQLREVIAQIGEVDDVSSITGGADLYEELGLDSMQGLEIVLEIERRFDLSVPEEALRRIRSLDDAVRVAMELGARDDA